MSHSTRLLFCTATLANVAPSKRGFNRTISLMYNFKALSTTIMLELLDDIGAPILCETECTSQKNRCFQTLPSFKLH